MISIDINPLTEDAKYAGLGNPAHRPYCLACNCFNRMSPLDDGWYCDPDRRDYQGRVGCGQFIRNKTQGGCGTGEMKT